MDYLILHVHGYVWILSYSQKMEKKKTKICAILVHLAIANCLL